MPGAERLLRHLHAHGVPMAVSRGTRRAHELITSAIGAPVHGLPRARTLP